MSPDLPRRWVLASGNRGKLRELRQLLAPMDLTLLSQAELGVTFVENALAKARAAAQQSRLPALADDSGLTVDALDGAPGIRSARFAGEQASDQDNVARLLELLSAVPADHRTASFHCVLVGLLHAEDPAPLIAQGIWHGRISNGPRGEGGFGYDPVFIGAGLDVTAAQLAPGEKNRISHRGRALKALLEALQDTRGQ
jgi:XTP/dITP diphosphohydrolase